MAEFIRRRPRPGSLLEGPARMPESWDESISAEVAGVLAESRPVADAMLGLTYDLEVKLPGTRRPSATGPCASPRRRSSPAPRPSWTRPRLARPSSWCWAGPGG